jgi:hypothetical protein
VVFGPEGEQEEEGADGDDFKSGDGPWIADTSAEGILDGVGGGGEEDAELIGEAGHEAAGGVRGKFVEVDRDDAPGALHAGVEKKSEEIML